MPDDCATKGDRDVRLAILDCWALAHVGGKVALTDPQNRREGFNIATDVLPSVVAPSEWGCGN